MSAKKPSHQEALNNVMQSPSIKQCQSISIPKATPAGKPEVTEPGFTSMGKGCSVYTPPPENDCLAILPLRYTLSLDGLNSMQEAAQAFEPPSQLFCHNDYEVLRLRQGYVYILTSNNDWLVFYFFTDVDDDNGPSLKSERQTAVLPYSFTEYIVDQNWKKTDQASEFIYLKKDQSKFSIAYCEERWPEQLFKDIEEDSQLRSQIMTDVDLNAPKGHTASIGFLTSVSRVFSEKEENFYAENLVRHTLCTKADKSFIQKTKKLNEHYIVGLFDPIGESLDLNSYIEYYNSIYVKFYDDHQHAIITGKMIEDLQKGDSKYKYTPTTHPNGRDETPWIDKTKRENIPTILTPPLRYEYDTYYPKLKAELESLDNDKQVLHKKLSAKPRKTIDRD